MLPTMLEGPGACVVVVSPSNVDLQTWGHILSSRVPETDTVKHIHMKLTHSNTYTYEVYTP